MSSQRPAPRPTRGFEALPIFWQLLGLCLMVLILTLSINFAVVLFSPPPQPSGYRLSEAVTAITRGEAKLANGKTLRAVTLAAAPVTIGRPDRRYRLMSQLIQAHLARKLNIKPDLISISMSDHGAHSGFLGRFNGGHSGPGEDHTGPMINIWSEPVTPPAGARSGGVSQQLFIREIEPVRIAPPTREAGPNGAPSDDLLPPNLLPPGLGPTDKAVQVPFSQSFSEQVSFPPFTAVIHQPDGRFRVLVPPHNWLDPWQWRLILGLSLTAVCIVPLAFVLSKRLSAPMVSLAEAASNMGFGPDSLPLRVIGPRELRAATDVLNAMQVRLRSYVDNRTALITAIAHDLKTPLARLRLRVEGLPRDFQDKFNADISHMDSLINSALSFAGAERLSLSLVPLDLSALIESLCEDLQEVHPIRTLNIEPGLICEGDATSLKRILTNLIENALRYGGDCDVRAFTNPETPSQIIILVQDDGPGLPDSLLEPVFEPFFRLESSRNRSTGGVGLGLSLARKLTEAHRGTLTLRNRKSEAGQTGLEAVITLPKWAKAG